MTPDSSPQRLLGLREVIALIVGIVIGAGIFKAPSMVAGMTGGAAPMFGAWLLGGVISLVGALCYAELASAYPHAGGDYHFLRRAYGRSVAFLFGWARFSVIVTGSIALLGFVVGDYLNEVLPLGRHGGALYAGAAVLALSWLNLRGIRPATIAQSWLTAMEVAGLLAIVAAALFLGDASPLPAPAATQASGPPPAAFGLAMVFVLLTYGGWNEAAYVSAEVKDGRRNMVRALAWSIAFITALYLAVTWAYWKTLGLEGMARSEALAADVLRIAVGPVAAKLMALMVAVAALTSMNATMIVGARGNYALGADWPALAFFHGWDASRGAPRNAFRIQCIAALLLVAVGAWTGSGFKSMVEFTAPVFWLFFLLTGIALFVLRVREPATERPFRVPLFPVLPIVFCLTCAYMLWSSLSYVHSQRFGGFNAAWIGVAVLASGFAFLAALRAAARRRLEGPVPQPVPSRRDP
jgi:APA family basic amino acid/polyamine antiporter